MKETKEIDLMAELKAILNGSCIWCEKGLPHPAYSRCPANERFAQPVLIPVPAYRDSRNYPARAA